MRKAIIITVAFAALNAHAEQLCGRVSYSTFDNGATTVHLFTEKYVFTAYSTNQDVDYKLRHLSSRKRNVCLQGNVDERKLEISVESIEPQ